MKDTWKVIVAVVFIGFCLNFCRSMSTTRRPDPRPVRAAEPAAVLSPVAPAAVVSQPPPALQVTIIPQWFASQGTWKEIERPSDAWYLKKQLTESSQALGFTVSALSRQFA